MQALSSLANPGSPYQYKAAKPAHGKGRLERLSRPLVYAAYLRTRSKMMPAVSSTALLETSITMQPSFFITASA